MDHLIIPLRLWGRWRRRNVVDDLEDDDAQRPGIEQGLVAVTATREGLWRQVLDDAAKGGKRVRLSHNFGEAEVAGDEFEQRVAPFLGVLVYGLLSVHAHAGQGEVWPQSLAKVSNNFAAMYSSLSVQGEPRMASSCANIPHATGRWSCSCVSCGEPASLGVAQFGCGSQPAKKWANSGCSLETDSRRLLRPFRRLVYLRINNDDEHVILGKTVGGRAPELARRPAQGKAVI